MGVIEENEMDDKVLKTIAALRVARAYALDQKHRLPIWVEGRDTLNPEREEWHQIADAIADDIELLGGKVLR
jgi:hypothetical protein